MSDFVLIFYWYLLLFVFGFGFFPLSFIVFNKFKDKGYGFSKIIAILLLSYIVWLLSSFKVFNFQILGLWIVLIPLGFWLLLFYKFSKTKDKVVLFLKDNFKLVLLQELIFIFGLVFWSWIRSHQPSIEGLEKFMDFGFVNSILRSQFMPPKDMWLTGYNINYYYFGHFITAFLTKISSLPSHYTYNLMLATVMALSMATAFSFSFNFLKILVKKSSEKIAIAGGLIAAFLLNFSGNLHTIVFAFRKEVSYWYPDATRFIGYNPDVADKTIHEFPSYSYVVADLHGHMISIPNVILSIALIFYFLHFILKNKNQTIKNLYILLLGFLLAILYLTNSWDLPIYFVVFFLSLLTYSLIHIKNSSQRTFNFIFYPLALIVLWFIFTLPYNLSFVNFSKGIGLTWTHSKFYQLLTLWGFGWWFSLSFFAYQAIKFIKSKAKNKIKAFSFPILFILILSLCSIGLIIVPEFFYLKDIYIKEYYRANTMFKLGYQAFIMSSLTSSIILFYFLQEKVKKRKIKVIKNAWLLISAALTTSVMIYPYFSIKGYYGDLKNKYSLNGWKYLQDNHQGDLAAINWLKKNITGQPIVLEAVGDSYTVYSRISANTGLPTILGWPVHEWLWRGSYDIPGQRTAEVKNAYETTNPELLKQFLQKYDVRYIILGKLEKEKYKNLNKENIEKLSTPVFTNLNTTIYQVK